MKNHMQSPETEIMWICWALFEEESRGIISSDLIIFGGFKPFETIVRQNDCQLDGRRQNR